MGQLGFFDAGNRLEALSAKGDPLESIDRLVPLGELSRRDRGGGAQVGGAKEEQRRPEAVRCPPEVQDAIRPLVKSARDASGVAHSVSEIQIIFAFYTSTRHSCCAARALNNNFRIFRCAKLS